MTNTITILLAFVGTIAIGLNIAATIAIARDSISEPMQRLSQLLVVWALPLIGSLLVLAIHRSAEKASGRYVDRNGPDDELTGIDVVEPAGDGASE